MQGDESQEIRLPKKGTRAPGQVQQSVDSATVAARATPGLKEGLEAAEAAKQGPGRLLCLRLDALRLH